MGEKKTLSRSEGGIGYQEPVARSIRTNIDLSSRFSCSDSARDAFWHGVVVFNGKCAEMYVWDPARNMPWCMVS